MVNIYVWIWLWNREISEEVFNCEESSAGYSSEDVIF